MITGFLVFTSLIPPPPPSNSSEVQCLYNAYVLFLSYTFFVQSCSSKELTNPGKTSLTPLDLHFFITRLDSALIIYFISKCK